MSNNKRALLILVIITLISLGIYSFQTYQAGRETMEVASNQSQEIQSSNQNSTSDNISTAPDLSGNSTDSQSNILAGSYTDYDPELDLPPQGSVLFFHASWCPSCKALDTELSSKESDIPEGLNVYKVDYDSNQSLRQKYGVTSQHTLVKVDGEGQLIKKEVGLYQLEKLEDIINFYQS